MSHATTNVKQNAEVASKCCISQLPSDRWKTDVAEWQ